MDYIKKFKNHSEYEVVKIDLPDPNVSYCANQADVHYKVKDYKNEYLTFEALEDGTFSLDIGSAVSTSVLTSISYSVDNGETWTTTNNVNSQAVTITTPTVTAGNTVMWKGNGTGVSTTINNNDRPSTSSIFSSTGTFNAKGNILSLIYGDDFAEEDSVTGTYNFALLFYSYNTVKTAKIVNCEKMELPIKNVSSYCYFRMFQGCSTLVRPMRVIEGESMGSGCCFSMFFACTGLKEGPKLPAMSLNTQCYRAMFQRCYSLTKAPEFPCTSVPASAYMQTFYECTGLTVAPDLPSSSLTNACYGQMFNGCSSLALPPKMAFSSTATSACTSMFQGCTSLTTAPELPATTLANICYYGMFRNCTSLIATPELPATTLTDYCYCNMFHTCTSLSKVTELPSTALTIGCYSNMFKYCASLATAPELPATILIDGIEESGGTGCYESMFQGCTSLRTAPELPATTLAIRCYYDMFNGCTSLVATPELPATTLALKGYYQMFYGCTNINAITCLATDISASDSTTNWVSGVAASGTFTKAASMESWTTGANGIPNGWTVNDYQT